MLISGRGLSLIKLLKSWQLWHIIEESLLDEESVSGVHSGRAKKSYREYMKRWSRLLKYDSNFFLVHKHINMYMDTNTDYFIPLALCVWNTKMFYYARTMLKWL